MEQKKYYSHSTRPGSLKEINMEGLMKQWGGGEVLRRAVRGMLPKNRLRDVRLRRLKGEREREISLFSNGESVVRGLGLLIAAVF